MEHDLWSILPAWFLTRSELRASAMPEPRILTAGRMLNRQGAYFARLNTISARPPCLSTNDAAGSVAALAAKRTNC